MRKKLSYIATEKYRKAVCYIDPEKAAEKARKYKEYIRVKQRESKRKRKLEAIEYLGGKCRKCENIYHPAIYEFHHKDPITKDRDPSKMLSLSWNRLQNELDKCDLLCANCHRLVHHGDNY
jgi:predicted HNH restriction endonuclease